METSGVSLHVCDAHDEIGARRAALGLCCPDRRKRAVFSLGAGAFGEKQRPPTGKRVCAWGRVCGCFLVLGFHTLLPTLTKSLGSGDIAVSLKQWRSCTNSSDFITWYVVEDGEEKVKCRAMEEGKETSVCHHVWGLSWTRKRRVRQGPGCKTSLMTRCGGHVKFTALNRSSHAVRLGLHSLGSGRKWGDCPPFHEHVPGPSAQSVSARPGCWGAGGPRSHGGSGGSAPLL